MSYPEFFSHLHENEQPQQAESEPALITEEAARPAVSNQQSRQPALKREQFRDDLSGWIAAMYNELVEDVIGKMQRTVHFITFEKMMDELLVKCTTWHTLKYLVPKFL